MNQAAWGKGLGGRAVSLAIGMVAASLAFEAAAQTPLEKAEQDQLVWAQKGDPEMARAMRKARETLDSFLAVAEAPPASTRAHALKIGLRQGAKTEFVWISPFKRDGDRFVGTLNNTPRMVMTHSKGDELPFTRGEIVDWTYIEDDRMRGNFTACPLLAKSPPAEQDAFKKRLGLSCDF